MYMEANYSIDPERIHIDINRKKAYFYRKEGEGFITFLKQTVLMLWIYFYASILLVFIFSVIFDLDYLFGINPKPNPLFVFILAFLLIFWALYGLYLAFCDCYLKTNLISSWHKLSFATTKIIGFNAFDLSLFKPEFIKAHSKCEEVKVLHPTYGFEWEATGDHRKYLSDVVFYHSKGKEIVSKPDKYSFGKLSIELPKARCIIKFFFDEVPKTGLIRLDVY